MDTFPAKERCTKPCNITQSDVFLRKVLDTKGLRNKNRLKLKFANRVVHITKILDYGISNFVIDLGSSLGLWFGLSVFGLTDLAALFLNWLMSMWQNTIQKYLN